MQHSRNASASFYRLRLDNGLPPPKRFKSAAKMSDTELAAMLEGADDYIGKRHMVDVAMSKDLVSPEDRERAIDQANKDQDSRFLRLEDLMLEDLLRRVDGRGLRWERDESAFIHVALAEDEEVEDEKNEDTDGSGEEEEHEQDDTTTTTGSSSVADDAGATIIMAAAANNLDG